MLRLQVEQADLVRVPLALCRQGRGEEHIEVAGLTHRLGHPLQLGPDPGSLSILDEIAEQRERRA